MHALKKNISVRNAKRQLRNVTYTQNHNKSGLVTLDTLGIIKTPIPSSKNSNPVYDDP